MSSVLICQIHKCPLYNLLLKCKCNVDITSPNVQIDKLRKLVQVLYV